MNTTALEISPRYSALQKALNLHAKKATLTERLTLIEKVAEDFQTLADFADTITSEEIDQALRAITAYVDRAILQGAILL